MGLGPGTDWNGDVTSGNGAAGEGRSGRVVLTGQLRCADDSQADMVRRHLARHIELTRAEPGCVSFEVHQGSGPLVRQVEEVFADQAALDRHQERVAARLWGRQTQGIEHRYAIR